MTINTKLLAAGALTLAVTIGAAGGSLLSAIPAFAQTTPNVVTAQTAQTPSQGSQQGNFDPSKGGHTANGKTEELLTGDAAEKAKAAALRAFPGGTIQRVETDADGAVYEAHMTKADGSQVTVLFDANFNVTGTESGHGGGKQG